MYRQGDVLLKPHPIPIDSKKVIEQPIVLAWGEITGHKHQIEEKATELLEYEGVRYLRVPTEGAKLKHEEHGTIALAPGEYRIVTQREYTPKAIVNVLD